MARHQNVQWNLSQLGDGGALAVDQIQVAVLMDIRDELQTLNRLLGCENFTRIPQTLRTISKKLPPKRCRRKHA